MADSVLVFVSAESLEFNFSPVIEKILPATVACSWRINHTMPARNSVISLSWSLTLNIKHSSVELSSMT